MPILTIQQRMTEVGRIRLGERKGNRPSRLDHFRLTSQRKDVLDAAAAVYGGLVEPWASDQGPQHQLTIEADALDVLIAPGESFTQWFELWTGGGCARRCNGITVESLDGKDVRDREVECMCPRDVSERVDMAASGAACKPTTRLSVWLPRLLGIGVWRAETHGFYSAAELPAKVSLLQSLAAQGYCPSAILRIATRSVKRPNQPTKTFPVLDLDVPEVTISALLAEGISLSGDGVAVLGPTTAAQLTAGNGVKQIGPGFNEPPTGHVPSPRERVARPGNGTPVDLAAGSDMRKPAPAGPRPVVEPTTGGFVIDDDDPGPGAAAATTSAIDNGLTPQQFLDMAKSHGLGTGQLLRAAREQFPGTDGLSALTDDQRGALLDEIVKSRDAAATSAG